MLTDLFGVTLAGMQTPEMRSLVQTWHAPAGPSPVPGTDLRTTPETAAYLSAVAACVLELDEGNKYAAGHPAAHVVFAATAAARVAPSPVSGEEFLTAVAAGYEVAARFGRATHRHPAWHTHGHWGTTGAAAAAALLMGADGRQVAAAIDASTALMQVTPWATVLSGNFSRNLWLAGANLAGLNAARLASAGLVENSGQVRASLGEIVGTFDPDALTEGLGRTWMVSAGYLKQHASCSYTHAAVDLVQALGRQSPWEAEDVAGVDVRIHSLARDLFGRHPHNRLAAMFSLPFVVGNAVVNGRVDPTTMQPGTEAFDAAERLSDRVSVEVDAEFDALLPSRRCTEVRIRFANGSSIALAQPNPLGDADYFPFTAEDVRRKLDALIGTTATRHVEEQVAALPDGAPVVPLLDALATASG